LDEDPFQQVLNSATESGIDSLLPDLGILLAVIILLIITSALISGSEAAFFSLSPSEISDIRHSSAKNKKAAARIIDLPRELLATLLVTGNLLNIAIIIISALLASEYFPGSGPQGSFYRLQH